MRSQSARKFSRVECCEVGSMRSVPGFMICPGGGISHQSAAPDIVPASKRKATVPDCASPQPAYIYCSQSTRAKEQAMCRNIKTLFNFEPPATEDEIQASALQFVRKLSGFNKPSQANEAAFERAVAEVSASARRLLISLHTHAPARDREIEAEKAKERSKLRFG